MVPTYQHVPTGSQGKSSMIRKGVSSSSSSLGLNACPLPALQLLVQVNDHGFWGVEKHTDMASLDADASHRVIWIGLKKIDIWDNVNPRVTNNALLIRGYSQIVIIWYIQYIVYPILIPAWNEGILVARLCCCAWHSWKGLRHWHTPTATGHCADPRSSSATVQCLGNWESTMFANHNSICGLQISLITFIYEMIFTSHQHGQRLSCTYIEK